MTSASSSQHTGQHAEEGGPAVDAAESREDPRSPATASSPARSSSPGPSYAQTDPTSHTQPEEVIILGDGEEGSSDRPTDEQIMVQHNGIRAEGKMPYVCDQEPLSALKQEYASGSSDVFVRKITQMEALGYTHLRRTAGDGNCFFRGFIFGYLESVLASSDIKERDRMVACLKALAPVLVEQGFQSLVFEDAQQMLEEQVDTIAHFEKPLTLETLIFNFRDDTISNMIVMYLRMVTSAEIKRRQEFFLPFILGMYDDDFSTLDLFLQHHVECLGEESDHIHIVAITEALQVPVRVVYLDRSGAAQFGGGNDDAEINCHDFVPEGMPADTVPRVHLLYRPGHFDVLYLA